MEIVLYICLLIVPFISIAALVMSIQAIRRLEALRKLVIEIAHTKKNEPEVSQAITDYAIKTL